MMPHRFPSRWFFLIALVAFAVLADGPARAALQAQPAAAQKPAAGTAVQAPSTSPVAEQPKPAEGFRLPPEKYEKAVAFARARYGLYFIGFVYGLVVLLLVLRWRIAPKFRALAERPGRRRIVQVIVFAPLFLLTLDVLDLPAEIYGQWLSRKYDQSIQSWGSWSWDWLKGEILTVIIGSILVWILYGVIRRSPRRWWFYFWLISIPIGVSLLFIKPIAVDPLFFKFTPLTRTQPELAAQIERVVQRAGMDIPESKMFEMNASAKLNSVNAYVTGIGASKRVVVWDTTIKDMTPPEVLFVFGHEMGHYVLGHVRNGILFVIAVLFVFLYLGYRGMHSALRRWGDGWGIRSADDWASLPVLLLFLSILGFLFSPVFNGFSRYQEHQADVYGLEVIHGIVPDTQQVAAQAFQTLGEIDLSDPNPSAFIRFWLFSHPPINERIRFARSYDPWGKEEVPEYVK